MYYIAVENMTTDDRNEFDRLINEDDNGKKSVADILSHVITAGGEIG